MKDNLADAKYSHDGDIEYKASKEDNCDEIYSS